jgi:hypothetical protein
LLVVALVGVRSVSVASRVGHGVVDVLFHGSCSVP